jgi:plastocyanin
MGSSGKSGKSGKGGFTPGFDWSVKIVQVSPGVAGFQPDVLGAKVGDSIQAQVSDIVTWGNTTADTHQPVRVDNGQSLCDPIAGGGSSTPQFVVEGAVGDVISYKCSFHPQEAGSITIVANFI